MEKKVEAIKYQIGKNQKNEEIGEFLSLNPSSSSIRYGKEERPGTLPNLKKMFSRPTFFGFKTNRKHLHAPSVRKDIIPDNIQKVNILRRSVSELHIASKNYGDKHDTDSDTGFSSLDSFDGDANLETLV